MHVATQVLPANPADTPESTITYDALDLMWLDGLQDVRAMWPPAQSAQTTSSSKHESVPSHWRCSNLDMLHWYHDWKALPGTQTFNDLPLVSTSELLVQLGVPAQQLQTVMAQMAPNSLCLLRRVVLPAFKRDVAALIADQLPELDLLSKFEANQLIAG